MNEQDHRRALVDRMQFLGQMASTETALFHQRAAAVYGLGITDMKAVSVLLQEGAMTAGQLGQRLQLTTGAITNVIDRLERDQWVRREADAQDRRKVIVTVNPAKVTDGDAVYGSMGAAFEQLLEDYSTAEIELLVRYQEASIAVTQQELAELQGKRLV